MKKYRILFCTSVLRHPPVGGPELRIENSIKALSKVGKLRVYSRKWERDIGGAEATRFYEKWCSGLVYASHVRAQCKGTVFVQRALNFVCKRAMGRIPFPSVYESLREDYGDVLREAHRFRTDVIWLGFGNVSYPLLKYIKDNSKYPVVLDTDSVWSRFVLRELPYARNEEERLRIAEDGRSKECEEQWGTRMADVTTAVSDVDADYYRKLTNKPEKIHLFSNVIDLNSYMKIPFPADGMRRPCVYLAGSFWNNSPMEQAARWVIKHVWPRLVEGHPSLQFYIVGKNSNVVLSDVDIKGVSIVGEVPSVLPYLYHADVVLVPLMFESGTRFKILEAGACSRAVVSTTLGAEGIPVKSGYDILIADESDGFAEAVLRLLNDEALRRQLGNNLHNLVEMHYGLDAHAQEAEMILKFLADRPSQNK